MPQSPSQEELPKVERPRLPIGRLVSYNQFPMHYENIKQMTADLPRIKAMNFKTVWVNPVTEPCKDTTWIQGELARGLPPEASNDERKVHSKPGSPYAMRSFNISDRVSAHVNEALPDDVRREKDYADIRTYTDTARKNGLEPLYDIVMRHVASDNPLAQEKPHWFKHHPSGCFQIFGRLDNYRMNNEARPWDDVLEFNFDDPKIRKEIVEQHIKPMMDTMVDKWGFEGVRIDTAGKLPRELYEEIIPYLDKKCMQNFGKPAVVLGETLCLNVEEPRHTGGFMDYVYNSIYFQPMTKEVWKKDDTWFSETKGKLQATVGPTIGFAGNHDERRLAEYYSNKNHIRGDLLRDVVTAGCIDNEIDLGKVMKRFISLNEQKIFTPDQHRRIMAVALQTGVIDAERHAQMEKMLNERGTIVQQEYKALMQTHPPTELSGGGSMVFRAMMNEMFEVVKAEAHREEVEVYTMGRLQKPKIIDDSQFIKLLPGGPLEEPRLTRLIKEAFCFAAFASDGGWYFSQGDEWGVTKRSNVFTSTPKDLEQRAYPDMDLSNHVKNINSVLQKLPPPGRPEWVQRCYLKCPKQDKALASFIIHQGEGFGGEAHVVIANVSDTKQALDFSTFLEIGEANGRNINADKQMPPKAVYIVGDIEISQQVRNGLSSRGIKIFETEPKTLAKRETSSSALALINKEPGSFGRGANNTGTGPATGPATGLRPKDE